MTIADILEEGMLGFFWHLSDGPVDLEGEPERGHVSVDGGWATIDLLDEDPPGEDEKEGGISPGAIVGVMPEEAALFLEVRGPWSSRRFGGPRASSKRYLSRTVVGSAPVNRIRSPSLLGLNAHFQGIGQWAGMSAVRENPTTDEEGRLRSWSVTLVESDDLSHKLLDGRDIVLSTTWKVGGPPDRREIYAPVSIGCISNRPKSPWDLLQPLLLAQDLLGFAFDGFVAAEGGSAQLDLAQEDRLDTTPSLWNGALMVQNPGAPAPASMNEFPLFGLDTMGGISGLARWIRLNLRHPRATRPVTLPYRHGFSDPETSVMDIATGIEYWVKANQPARWAAGKKYPRNLAVRCGKAFAEWVGDPHVWAKAFWDAYNHLKHETTYEPDPIELLDLAASARYLLGASLLNRVAGSHAPSRQVFRHHRLRSLGSQIRGRYS